MLRSYGGLCAVALLLSCGGSAGAEQADGSMVWRVQQRCNPSSCQILLDQCAAGCRSVGPSSYQGCMGSCRTRYQSCVQATCQRR